MAGLIIVFFFIGIAIQIVLLSYVFPKILFFKNIKGNSNPVSIIIAAHNELDNLKHLVPLLLAQDHPNFEIIIANDRSTDGSIEYLNSFTNEKLKVLTISEVPANFHPKKYALSQAIQKAKNEIVLFTDADCIPISDQWAKEMQHSMIGNTEIVLGYSPYLKKKDFLNLFIRFETLLTAIQYLSFAIINLPYMGVGRNLSYKKSLFTKANGFGKFSGVTGGDDDLFVGKVSNSHNTTVCLSTNTKVYSIAKTNWRDFFIQKLRHLSVGKNYTLNHQLIAGLFPGSLFLIYASFALSLVFSVNISAILILFILRTLVLIVIFALITRKLGDPIKWYWIPLLDLIYLTYYLITGIAAIFSKSIKWI